MRMPKRDVLFAVAVTPDEKKEIERRAKEKGISISAYVRMAIYEYMKKKG